VLLTMPNALRAIVYDLLKCPRGSTRSVWPYTIACDLQLTNIGICSTLRHAQDSVEAICGGNYSPSRDVDDDDDDDE